jgi:hypothetical protein
MSLMRANTPERSPSSEMFAETVPTKLSAKFPRCRAPTLRHPWLRPTLSRGLAGASMRPENHKEAARPFGPAWREEATHQTSPSLRNMRWRLSAQIPFFTGNLCRFPIPPLLQAGMRRPASLPAIVSTTAPALRCGACRLAGKVGGRVVRKQGQQAAGHARESLLPA